MNRHDRDYDYNKDYDRYEGYDRDDRDYHGARNLTNQFERHYQREHEHRHDNRNHENRNYHPHEQSYHEGDMGGAYERFQNRGWDHDNNDYPRNNWDYEHEQNSRNFRNNKDRDRYHDDRHIGVPYQQRNVDRDNWDSRDRYPGSGADTRRARYEDRGNYHWSNPDRDRYETNRYY